MLANKVLKYCYSHKSTTRKTVVWRSIMACQRSYSTGLYWDGWPWPSTGRHTSLACNQPPRPT